MKIDYPFDETWQILTEIIDLQLSVEESWKQLIDFLQSKYSKPFWTELKQLDILGEQDDFREWLEMLAANYPIDISVKALWIGISQLSEKQDIIPVVYLAGCKEYSTENIEWTSEMIYTPENRYVAPPVMKNMNSIILHDEDYIFFDWILPLAYCAFTLDDLIRNGLDKSLFLRKSKRIFITVGHDGGDFLSLTTIE